MHTPITFAVSGHAGTGKGTLIQLLKILYGNGITIASTRAIIETKLREELGIAEVAERHVKADGFVELDKRYKDLGRPNWIMEEALLIWEQEGKPFRGFDALRMLEQAHWLRERCQPLTMFHTEAPIEVCIERVRKRALLGGPDAKPEEAHITREDYLKAREHKTAVSIDLIGKLPGVFVIQNIDVRKTGASIIAYLMSKRILGAIGEDDPRREVLETFYRTVEES